MQPGHRRKNLFTIAVLAILVIIFYLPLLQDIKTGLPALDWYGVYAFPSFFRISVLQYHQFPLRSPYFAGGYPLIAHPYDTSLSPLSIIVLLCGAIEGTKLTVFLIFLIGSLSVFYLTRYILRYNLLGSFFSSATFALSSWGACQYRESNYEQLYIYFLPLIFAFFMKAAENRKYIFFSSLALSAVVLCAGATLVPAVLFLFLFACFHAVRIEQGPRIKPDFRYLKVFFLVILVAFFLCMAKILPMLNLLSRKDIGFTHFPYEHDYRRVSQTIVGQKRALNPVRLYEMLLVKDAYIVGTEGDDYLQIHLGYLPVLLGALSFIFFWRQNFRYLLLLITFILLSFGPNFRFDLFGWLWQLHPFIHNIWRLDEFFTFPILFVLSLVSGRFFHLSGKGSRRILFLFFIPVVLLSLNNMFWPNRRFLYNQIIEKKGNFKFQRQFYQVKIKDPQADPEHYQKDGYFYLQQNVGVADWLFTNLKIKSAVIPRYLVKSGDYQYISSAAENLEPNPEYRGEVFFLDKKNSARLEYFSPNEIRVAVMLKDADTLIINQNYHNAWRTSQGNLFDRNGLLAVALDKAGSYTVILRYVPLDFYFGMIISLVSLAVLGYLFIYKKDSYGS